MLAYLARFGAHGKDARKVIGQTAAGRTSRQIIKQLNEWLKGRNDEQTTA
jgi:hypothetical protein